MTAPDLDAVPALMQVIGDALATLGTKPDEVALEALAIQIYSAMESNSRIFHTSSHALNLAEGLAPAQVLAAVYHDVVYTQVDGDVPFRLRSVLEPWARFEDGEYRLTQPNRETPAHFRIVFGIFEARNACHQPGGNGLNELLSALVAVSVLHSYLGIRELFSVVACIEGTIPFRDNDEEHGWPKRLLTRLASLNQAEGLGLTDAALADTVQRAVVLANGDVSSFAAQDTGVFLDNTWMLLAESRAILRQPGLYHIDEYRLALTQMEGFLNSVDASRIFTSFMGVPDQYEFDRLRTRASENIAISVRYLRAKIYTVAVIEAAALATGGDLPLSLLMGMLPDVDRSVERLATSLAQVELKPRDGLDPVLDSLFERGHAHHNEFDLKRSPVSALIYRHLGDDGISTRLGEVRQFFDGEVDARALLDAQPRGVVRVIVTLLSRLAVVRREAFESLLTEYAH
jgi:hypothetical protein